jgi:hypothetical protein
MALEGNLRDIDLGDLIQLNCQSGARARLTAHHDDQESTLYFDDGDVVHAQLGGLEGEEAVYELLTWETGTFELKRDIGPPARTITTPWSALIMEGMRRRDERRQQGQSTGQLEEQEEPVREAVINDEKETSVMAKTRKEQLQETLRGITEQSSDIQGVAVISMDGLIIAAVLPQEMEQTRVGAVTAGILSLSGRSVEQLERGTLQRTMVQGSDGNIILMNAGKNAALAALTGSDVNLGLAFLEVSNGAQAVAEILG